MRGTIIADETWIGGDPANQHASVRAKRRIPTPITPEHRNLKTDKTAVLSLINTTTGEARSRIVPNVTGITLRKVIAEQVDMAGSHLRTDSLRSYLPIGQEFLSHESVDHSGGEYVRGDVTTNAIEELVLLPAQAVARRHPPPRQRRAPDPATWPSSTSATPPAR
ncbi:MAG: transposase [Actinobacteria bacterium]|nr:transposase [Actinomycetota bacterium]